MSFSEIQSEIVAQALREDVDLGKGKQLKNFIEKDCKEVIK